MWMVIKAWNRSNAAIRAYKLTDPLTSGQVRVSFAPGTGQLPGIDADSVARGGGQGDRARRADQDRVASSRLDRIDTNEAGSASSPPSASSAMP